MSKKRTLFPKVGKTVVVPMGLKILLIFISLILLSNFATNFISLQLSQKQIINLNNTIMVSHLKELYSNSSNQFQIYTYAQNKEDVVEGLKNVAESGFSNPNSIALAVKKDGSIDFLAWNNRDASWGKTFDAVAFARLEEKFNSGISEGSISFVDSEGAEYFGVYKYHPDWNYYLIRAEKRSDLNENLRHIYRITSIIIVVLTVVFIVIGFLIINREFKTVRTITSNLFEMQKKKQLDLIDLSDATNDDITYLAASFNSLSASVNSLLFTFQKFVSKDVVAKAYSEQGISLEGSQQELTILFSDIKGFTYRTETLGNDIIDVLNVHYNHVIHKIHENSGVVGSIIGDAILAIYGALDSSLSKSYNALLAAWDITRVTAKLRQIMIERRADIEKTRTLSPSELRIFEAVLIDVGVGLDGGNVFYGNIGSNEHMANTVIGDSVNSASRLEGLTRFYHLPVIASEYVKSEVEKFSKRFIFFEIDTVLLRGKSSGKKIYFPFDTEEMDAELLAKFYIFEDGLSAYYEGDWKKARKKFSECKLDVTQIFTERMGRSNPPQNWNGIWTMDTK